MKAVYVHVRLEASELVSDEFCSKARNGELKMEDYDAVICTRINCALQDSGCLRHKDRVTVAALQDFMRIEGSATYFLFHFDEMGTFEGLEPRAIAVTMIHRIWAIADQLQHFYILSGRSSYLSLIGKGINFPAMGELTSPARSKTICLPLLSSPSVAAMFTLRGMATWISRNNNLSSVLTLTSGVPRAVVVLIRLVMCAKLDLDDESEAGISQNTRIQASLVRDCPVTYVETKDIAKFNILLELSWAQAEIPVDAVIHGEPLSAVLARLGMYSNSSTDGNFCRIMVPLYQLRAQAFSPRSLCAIGEYQNVGARLEAGFRRVLHLRLFSRPSGCQEWKTVGLPFLDERKVPFPAADLGRCYAFPKISDAADGTPEEAVKIMTIIHKGQTVNMGRQTVHPKLLPDLFAQLELGQYYQPVPMSRRADAFFRVGTKCVIQFQFKHFEDPMTEEMADEEAGKCAAEGWDTFVVVFCTATHSFLEEVVKEYTYKTAKVTMLMLSAASVKQFLGQHALEAIQPEDKLVVDESLMRNCSGAKRPKLV